MPRSGPIVIAIVSVMFSMAASAVVPNAPTNITVTSTSYNNIRLDWTDNSSEEAGFQVQYRVGTTGDFASLVPLFPANTTAVSLTTSADTTYQLQVRAVSSDSTPLYSTVAGPVTVTTPAYPVSSATYYSGLLGQPFSFQLVSAKSALVTSYSVSALPPGLSLNSGTGLITGTPTSLGRTDLQVTINHSDGKIALGVLALRIFKSLPGLAGPAVIGTPPPVKLILGSPASIPLNNSFTDPDVSSAARLVTDLGNLDFAFYPESAPKTVANFLGYATRGDFNNTIFHRSISSFIVQGGAFRADATASAVITQAAVINEPEITNARGTVAMAKISGYPDSATNQFFINLADNGTNLNNQNEGFTVFARVAGNGMAVADAMAALPTGTYPTINSALTNTPVRVSPAPTIYDPAKLVRIASATPINPLAYTATSAAPTIASCVVNGSDLNLTAVAPGETHISITTTDLDGLTVTSDMPVTVLDTYDSWAARQGFAAPADAAATADPDHDGLTNSEEFALATGPLVHTTSNPAGRVDNGHLGIAFTLNTRAAGTLVTVQSATDPAGPWTDVWKSTDGFNHPWVGNSTLADGVASVVVRDPATVPDPATPRKFLRLKFN